MKSKMIHILGGGPAGLIAAYFAHKNNIPFKVYEAGGTWGGNCRTLTRNKFRFDAGAHRFHDKDPAVTELVNELLGDDLLEVNSPSQIYYDNRFIDFPLRAHNIIKKLPFKVISKVVAENLAKGREASNGYSNFKDFADAKYGPTLAGMFLHNYSEKLWGLPTVNLDTAITGNRLKGLTATSLIRAAFGLKAFNKHELDGTFFYPKYGIGSIFDALVNKFGKEHIAVNTPVTGIKASGKKILAIQLDGKQWTNTDVVINTLPIKLTLQILNPRVPRVLFDGINSIKYRHLRLLVLFLKKRPFSNNASIYFPEIRFPWSRIYESVNRSSAMAPEGKTSIVLEVPCFEDSRYWKLADAELLDEVLSILSREYILDPAEIMDYCSVKLPFAYPVLENDYEAKLEEPQSFLSELTNMHPLGRSATFQYIHIHDIFRQAEKIVKTIAG